MIYLYSGEGAGKSTSAFGLALRSLGHGHKVVIMQFMKWWGNTGEHKFKHPNYWIYLGGREGWHGKDNLTKKDKQYTLNFLWGTLIAIRLHKPDLLVLDEINLAVAWKLLREKDVINLISSIQKYYPKINIILTGRYAPQGLIDRSDFVNIITCVKMPKESICEEGIQY